MNVFGRSLRKQTDLVVVRWRVRNFGSVPLSIALQSFEDLLRVGVHQVGPGLPQRMDDVVDETNLKQKLIENMTKLIFFLVRHECKILFLLKLFLALRYTYMHAGGEGVSGYDIGPRRRIFFKPC